MKICELEIGNITEINLMVLSFEEKTTAKGKPYIQAELTDGSENIQVKFWDLDAKWFSDHFPKGSVISVPLNVGIYNDNRSYMAGNGYRRLLDEEFRLEDFIKLPPINPDELYLSSIGLVNSFDEKHLESKSLIKKLYEDNAEILPKWSAAKSIHHNLRGGLLWHSYRMALVASHLPMVQFNVDINTYERTMQAAVKKYGDEAVVSAEYIAEHTTKPVTVEEATVLMSGLDFSDPYLQIAKEILSEETILYLLSDRRIYQIIQLSDTVSDIYQNIDKNLMIATALLLASANETEDMIYSEQVICSGRYVIGRRVMEHVTKEAYILRAMIHSVTLSGKEIPIKEQIPEAYALNIIAKISAYSYADKQVVCGGCLIHDIGKLKELDTDELGVADYSTDGSLFGHMVLGMDMVCDATGVLGTSESIAGLYKHIIASHHGRIEWGALVTPAFPEAAIVHLLDLLDSRVFQYEEACSKLQSGEFSDKIFGLGCRVYKK